MGRPSISFALVLHNHQPVGNFGHVFAQNHELAYEPLLGALERHPRVRVGLHYTGPLLEWLRAERPQTVERLAALAARRQVEIVGGGYYEPVLASLPERDRVGQLRRMAEELTTLFGERPRGAWLAERVWEPDVPTSLVDAGYAWTILDDAHFRAAAIPDEEHWGAWSTDDQGKRLAIFGTEQGLRYRIPFGTVEAVIDYLRDQATEDGRRVGTMGDDGEKFGAWPTTWEHCWGKDRWVDRFFEALEANAGWLTMTTPSDWLEREPPVGRVYVPTGSYAEMGEWALPATEGMRYAEVLHADQADGRPEPRWMRGGFWRNFQVKYREINDLHKQMLRASGKVAAMPAGPARERALDHLYQGQSNDCYWHGLFGGIYLSHMRLATYEHLIAAEDAADRAARTAGAAPDGIARHDIDLDGVDELLVTTPGQIVTVKPSEGAGIGSWDVRAVRHALTSVLRRRPEAYHAKLVAFEAREGGDGAGGGETVGESEPASIHDIVKVREAGLADQLRYDAYERRSGLVHLLPTDTAPEAFAQASFRELGDFVEGAFAVESVEAGAVRLVRDGQLRAGAGARPVRCRKVLRVGGDRRRPSLDLEVTLTNTGAGPIETLVGVEWCLTMLGGGGNPSAWYDVDGRRLGHDSGGAAVSLASVSAGNDWVGISLATTVEPAADVWWSSIDTVSLSEDGFERTHQGSCLLFVWPLRLAAGAEMTFRMSHLVSTARDRAEEEGL